MHKKIHKHKKKFFGTGVVVLASIFVLVAGGMLVCASFQEPQSKKITEKALTRREITTNDAGKTFSYTVGSWFTVFLDKEHYPKGGLSCAPGGVVGVVGHITTTPPPLYGVRLEALAQGRCELRDKDFTVTIIVR